MDTIWIVLATYHDEDTYRWGARHGRGVAAICQTKEEAENRCLQLTKEHPHPESPLKAHYCFSVRELRENGPFPE